MQTRRSLLKSATLVVAGAPLLAYTPFEAWATAIPIDPPDTASGISSALLVSIQATLNAVYGAVKAGNVTDTQLGQLAQLMSMLQGIWNGNGMVTKLQSHFHPTTFVWSSTLAESVATQARALVSPVQSTDLNNMSYLSQYQSTISASVNTNLSTVAAIPINPRVPMPNGSCHNFQGMGVFTGILASLAVFFSAVVASIFGVVAAVYFGLDYLFGSC